jgi:hypothetical protein
MVCGILIVCSARRVGGKGTRSMMRGTNRTDGINSSRL